MSNMPVLWRNTVDGLTDGAAALYLRGVARDERKAFRMACRWQDNLEPILPVLVAKAAPTAQTAADVLMFMRERYFRRYFPDGRA